MYERFIRAAILEKRLLQFRYERRLRVVEPHLIGYDSQGELTLCGWQLPGELSQGWRDFHLAGISGLAIVDGASGAPRPGYNPNDRAMLRITFRL